LIEYSIIKTDDIHIDNHYTHLCVLKVINLEAVYVMSLCNGIESHLLFVGSDRFW
jgi:hypothetical protein